MILNMIIAIDFEPEFSYQISILRLEMEKAGEFSGPRAKEARMDSTDLKKMLIGLCLSGLLAGSGVGVTPSHASGG